MASPKILALAGSTREGSFNVRLRQAAAGAARSAGADVTEVDLAGYPLPIFNQDLESAGTPENATKLQELFFAHDGLLIASPEYNSSITPLLKNVIDWVSRKSCNHAALAAYQGKVATLLSASPGNLGGMRGLVHLRSILGNIGVIVLPDQVCISKAADAFADDGSLSDDKQQQKIERAVEALVELLTARAEGI